MLRIRAGRIVDPLNGRRGEQGDLCLRDGKVVGSLPAGAPVLDARGLVVMPGAIDLHTHLAAPAPGRPSGMNRGAIVVQGGAGEMAAGRMRRGTIVALGPPPGLLPVFLDAGRQAQPFLNLYDSLIEAAGIALPGAARRGLYRRLVGDISDLGKGEILVLEGGA